MTGFHIFILSWIAAVHAQNTGLAPSWTTSTGQSIYMHRLINLNCGGIDVTEVNTEYLIKLTDTNHIGCTFNTFNGRWIVLSNLPNGIELQNEVTVSYCDETLPATDIFYITLNVTSVLSTYDIRCYYRDDSGENSKSFVLPTFKEAPKNLRLVLNPEVVIEGSPFSVECMSDGGEPDSTFVYEIFESGSWSELSSASYTPSSADRTGLSVRCRDTAHLNWDIPSDITKSIDIRPAYIDFGETASADEQTKLFRPGTEFDNYELTCDLIGNPEVGNYTWTTDKSDVDFTGENNRVLTLDNSLRVNGEVERITCSGAVAGIQNRLTITWVITWSVAATTTTTTTITPEPQRSKAGLYGGIGGGIVLLVIVGVVIAVCLIKKRKAKSNGKSGGNIALSENGESRSHGKGRTPSKHSKDSTPLNQQHNDKPEIIYSDVQAISKPHPNTAMVRPHQRVDKPPEVEYSSIDFLKTDAQKGKPVVPTGPEYESVERGVHGEFNKPKQPRAPPRVSMPRNQAPPPPRSSPPGDLDI